MDCYASDYSARIAGGYDFILSSSNYCLAAGIHATGVAGIIAAAADGSGVIGVAPGVSLYTLRVCDESDTIPCTQAHIAAAFNWAVDNDMDVINFSLARCGGPLCSGEDSAVTRAVNAGIIVAAAVGNQQSETGPDYCPSHDSVSTFAKKDGVIGVTGILSNETLWAGYMQGADVDLAAPTYVITDSLGGGVWHGSGFGGTSGATPHVAGAAALLLSAGFASGDVLWRLLTEATKLGSGSLCFTCRNNQFGYGAINVLGAVHKRPEFTYWDTCSGSTQVWAGTCWFVPHFQYQDFAPTGFYYEMTPSNEAFETIFDWVYEGDTIWVDIPEADSIPGYYTIDVHYQPFEMSYLYRNGPDGWDAFKVCIGQPSMRMASPKRTITRRQLERRGFMPSILLPFQRQTKNVAKSSASMQAELICQPWSH